MTDRDSLIEKIQALLRKTTENGCTEGEALAALDKARALMDAYAVSDAELQLSQAETAIVHSEPPGARDPHRIKFYIASAVARFCDCEVWRSSQGFTFCGFPSDVGFASWLLNHLADFVQAELVSHLVGCLAPQKERREIIKGFVLGCAERINRTLAELCQRSTTDRVGNSHALVVIKSAAINDKKVQLGIKLRKSRTRYGRFDLEARAAGHRAGARASFGRPVSGAAAALRLRNNGS